MSDIQKARDVLAKWREAATQTPWELGFMLGDPHWAIVYADGIGEVINSRRDDNTVKAEDARLIVGTAGNPDLLDAVDGILRSYERIPEQHRPGAVNSIAAAITAADEQMSA